MHIDIDAAAGTGNDTPEDWRGRALAAEARVGELDQQLRVLRVVLAAFDEDTGS